MSSFHRAEPCRALLKEGKATSIKEGDFLGFQGCEVLQTLDELFFT